MNIFFIGGLIFFLGALSFALTYIIMRFAVKNKLTVVPNERSLHDLPTPKGGGIAIVLTWYAGITVMYFSGIIEARLFYALMSGIILAIVSFFDDLKELSPAFRLIIQFLTAILAFYLLGGLRPLVIPEININYSFFVYPLAITGMVWFINLFNFMDGVDGFASLEAIIICSVLFVFTWSLPTVLLIFCITGFLYWNWPKASIFMGDVGSTQLGFILVVMGIHFHNTLDFSVLNWVMLTSPFWFDATLTLFRRWRNGEKLSVAHRKHAYQRTVQAGSSHLKVNLFLFLINIILILLIVVYRAIKILQIPVFALSLIFFYILVRQVDKKIPFTRD